MQRRLIIMRHAKSSWSESGMADHDRPLNGRGRADAPRVAEHLVELGWTPDAIWSSDAQRTRETAALMVPAFEPAPSVAFDPGLYLAGLDAILGAAARWDEGCSTVLVLGHNPGWERAASSLAGRDLGLTTANAVLLTSEGSAEDWPEALRAGWAFEALLRPRDL